MTFARILDLSTIAFVVEAYKRYAVGGNPWGRALWHEDWQWGDDGQVYLPGNGGGHGH